MTERPTNSAEGEPYIKEYMVEDYPILEEWYFKERNRFKETGKPVWIQKSFESAEERVLEYFIEEEEPRAYILEDRKTGFCRSWVSLYKEGYEDQEVTVREEALVAAQPRVENIVSRIPVRIYEPEPGELELPGLP